MTQGNSFFSRIPTITKNLIIINFIVWLATMVLSSRTDFDLEKFGALHYFEASDFNPVQLITYMFMHADFTHFFFNMFALFMFGTTIERTLGQKRFLFYYISCGLGAAIIQEITWYFTWESIFTMPLANQNGISFEEMSQAIAQAQAMGIDMPFLNQLLTVGASGAVYGILLAFGMIFPNQPIYMMFIPIPIKAKYFVIGYGAIELLYGLSMANDGVAHFAHLGGMLFGLLMILYWKRKGIINGNYF
ncbi:MAG: rhomboid family intramembrane serine protease [Muribaculaceae bacterium]|nr:rhomboid family intramembrane serine protease [Muribaculaceae bacterium]